MTSAAYRFLSSKGDPFHGPGRRSLPGLEDRGWLWQLAVLERYA